MLVVKNLLANAGETGDLGSIPGSGRFPAGGHGNPLHYSCLENPMDRGAWQATVHGVAKSEMTERLTLSLSLTPASGPWHSLAVSSAWGSLHSWLVAFFHLGFISGVLSSKMPLVSTLIRCSPPTPTLSVHLPRFIALRVLITLSNDLIYISHFLFSVCLLYESRILFCSPLYPQGWEQKHIVGTQYTFVECWKGVGSKRGSPDGERGFGILSSWPC